MIPGTDIFGGTTRHTYDSARAWVIKRACVIVTSSSGLDRACNLAHRGAGVALLQCSPTYVMSHTHFLPYGIGSYAHNAKRDRADLEEMDRLCFAMLIGSSEELVKYLTSNYLMVCTWKICVHGVGDVTLTLDPPAKGDDIIKRARKRRLSKARSRWGKESLCGYPRIKLS